MNAQWRAICSRKNLKTDEYQLLNAEMLFNIDKGRYFLGKKNPAREPLLAGITQLTNQL